MCASHSLTSVQYSTPQMLIVNNLALTEIKNILNANTIKNLCDSNNVKASSKFNSIIQGHCLPSLVASERAQNDHISEVMRSGNPELRGQHARRRSGERVKILNAERSITYHLSGHCHCKPSGDRIAVRLFHTSPRYPG